MGKVTTRSRSRKNANVQQLIQHPPMLKSLNPKLEFRIRYQSASALSNVNINVGEFLDTLTFAASATVGYRTLQAIRMKSIRMWGPMSSTLTPVTVSVEWLSGTSSPLFGGPSKFISDTSIGSTACAHVRSTPPSESLSSKWFQGSSLQSTILCQLNGPTGTIIDIVWEGVFAASGVANSVSTAISGATAGVQYVRALDSAGSSLIVPLLVATI